MEILVFQLVALALNAALAVLAALSARRAASFDVTRDFDALCLAVERLQAAGRSEKMQRVRRAALEPAPAAAAPDLRTAPLTHDQLRALQNRRTG